MLFGCDEHEKVFVDHTEEEHLECGHVQLAPGRWLTAAEFEERYCQQEEDSDKVELNLAIREYDCGVVPDLHTDGAAEHWRRLGKQYVDGVGPIINSHAEERDFCRMTGHHIHGTQEIREVPLDYGLMGYQSKRTQRVKIDHGYEARFGKHIRSEAAIRDGMAKAQAQAKIEARARAELERLRGTGRRVFPVAKPQN